MRKGLLINLDRCSGCDSCIVACKLENDLPLGHFYNKVIAVGPTGTFPNVEKYWLPSQCQQCENPAARARMSHGGQLPRPQNRHGAHRQGEVHRLPVLHRTRCPYGVRQFNEDAGVVQKCTLCAQITADGDGVPACVHNCNCGARFFGDYDDPESDVSRELAKYPGGGHPHAARPQ